MKSEQLFWGNKNGWSALPSRAFTEDAQLVLVFGTRSELEKPEVLSRLAEFYPAASIVGCSTSGEIMGTEMLSETVVATALTFDHTRYQVAHTLVEDGGQSQSAGETLAQSLISPDLNHVLVVADGLCVNGSQLIEGFHRHLPSNVKITGGLAGDGERFEKTLVYCEGSLNSGQIAAIGFYGSRLKVGYGSVAGWVPFGPERLVTRSEGNVLYSLDGQQAIDLYRSILREDSADLSAARFFFPLEIRRDEGYPKLLRTIVGIDEKNQSLVFAGDVPEGYRARLMRVNPERLMEGAAGAARASMTSENGAPDLALLISCVGRRIVLKQRTFMELEAVREVLGSSIAMTGFYSYGELAPFATGGECHLHNETMTITTFSEV